jgi:NAD(P)-dependent dehydrogenase (short-subunit alcohol dehydrogenase family)
VRDPILVTGSASGIGAATVHFLRDVGQKVIGVDRRDADELCDLTDSSQIDALIARLPRKLAGIAHVAGVPGTLAPETVLAVNLLAPRRLSEHLVDRVHPGGGVVYVASVAAGRYAPEVTAQLDMADGALLAWLSDERLDGSTTYDFTKKALVALAMRHAREWIGRVRAVSVSPGPTDTPILADFRATMGEDRIDGAASIVGRHGRPDDSAAAIAFLLGKGAEWVNAIDLRVDGGLIGIR